MRSVLVTGGNRGIGLGLVRELLKEPSVTTVIATVRKLEAEELTAIENSKLHVVICDVTDEKSIAAAVVKVSEIVDGNGNGLDILINNAGIYLRQKLNASVTKAIAMEQLEVNVVGPMLVANISDFVSEVSRASQEGCGVKGHAQIANISSAFASLALAVDEDGCNSIYSISKAALNMLTCKLALEWKKYHIRATTFTPGWVRTDMGTADADLSVEESTSPLAKLILSLTEERNAEFYRYTGEKLPW